LRFSARVTIQLRSENDRDKLIAEMQYHFRS
jgi:hypothetical protein